MNENRLAGQTAIPPRQQQQMYPEEMNNNAFEEADRVGAQINQRPSAGPQDRKSFGGKTQQNQFGANQVKQNQFTRHQNQQKIPHGGISLDTGLMPETQGIRPSTTKHGGGRIHQKIPSQKPHMVQNQVLPEMAVKRGKNTIYPRNLQKLPLNSLDASRVPGQRASQNHRTIARDSSQGNFSLNQQHQQATLQSSHQYQGGGSTVGENSDRRNIRRLKQNYQQRISVGDSAAIQSFTLSDKQTPQQSSIIKQQGTNGGNTMGTQSTRFRIALPQMQSGLAPNGQPNQSNAQRQTSNHFWNKVSKQISKDEQQSHLHAKTTKQQMMTQQAHHNVSNQQSQNNKTGASNNHLSEGHPTSQNQLSQQAKTTNEMIMRHQQAKAGFQGTHTVVQTAESLYAKPFSFLANVGGKDTTTAKMTLRTGPGSQAGHYGPKGRQTLQTDIMDDQLQGLPGVHGKQRVVYLSSAASSKNLKAQKMAQVKSTLVFDQTSGQKQQQAGMIHSASIDTFKGGQGRLSSGLMSKQGSLSRLRGSNKQIPTLLSGNLRTYSNSNLSQVQHQKSVGNADKNNLDSARQHAKELSQAIGQAAGGDLQQMDLQEHIDEEEEDEYQQNRQMVPSNEPGQVGNFVQHLMEARPTTALVGGADAEDQLPYPELFDRSERTYAATFAKYGDLTYFTPVQRIGSYMEYSARLKKSHLMDLIAYLKTSKCQIKIDDENDANLGMQNAQDFLDHCLFHGLMPQQEAPTDDQLASDPQAVDIPTVTYANAREQQLDERKSYDPSSARVTLGIDFGKIWSPKLLKQVQISIYRMIHYIDSPDSIRNEELSRYKKEWLKKALDLVPDFLISTFPVEVKMLFHDIFQSFLRAMKVAIMDYILRSPDERKRLHILTLPHIVPTAAERQAERGGYSIIEFQGSHQRRIQAETEIRFRLITYNVVVSQLNSWWQEFRKVQLVDLRNFKFVIDHRNDQLIKDKASLQNVGAKDSSQANKNDMANFMTSRTLDFDNFMAFQEAMLEKTVSLMKHVWHRGAILIIKKFKMLRSKQQQEALLGGHAAKSKWTFSGYHPLPADLDFGFESREYEHFEHELDQVKTFEFEGDNTTQRKDTKFDAYQAYCLRTQALLHNCSSKLYRVAECDKLDATIAEKDVEEFDENVALEDLVDIREIPSYIAFVSMVGGYTNYEENGYDILAKTYKKELKYAAGNLMKIQLRQMIDQSVQTLTNFFKGFKTYAQFKESQKGFVPIYKHKQVNTNVRDERKKEVEKAAAQARKRAAENVAGNQRLQEQLRKRESQKDVNPEAKQQRLLFSNAVSDPIQLVWPDFMDLQDYMNPVLRIELLLGQMNENNNQNVENGQSNKQHSFTNNESSPQFLNTSIAFNKSDEQILKSVEQFYDDLVTCFNDFNRPEFCKIQVYSQKKYEIEMQELEASRKINLDNVRQNRRRNTQSQAQNQEELQKALKTALKQGVFKPVHAQQIHPKQINFDKLLYNEIFEGPYSYERYMGRVKVKEAPADIVSKKLHENEGTQNESVFSHQSVLRRMQIARPNEFLFKKCRRECLEILKSHLIEVKRVKELFIQFKMIVNGEMQRKVSEFVANPTNSLSRLSDFAVFLNELRTYRALSLEIPERVAFPLFEVGTTIVKQEIQTRIDKFIYSVLWRFECDLKERSRGICGQFTEIQEELAKVLSSAEDVVEMDNYKNNLLTEMAEIQQNMNFTRRCVYFLLCQNDTQKIFRPFDENSADLMPGEGECFKFVQELIAWPQKLNDLMEQADERHADERSNVEKMVLDKKKLFDQEVSKLNSRMKKVTTWSDLKQYKYIMDEIHEFKAGLDRLEHLKQEITLEESLLFQSKSEFNALASVARFFEPYYELWTRINDMMTKKNEWEMSRLSDIDADEVNQMHKESIRSLQKLQKVFSSQSHISNILRSMNREITELEEWRPTIEALCNKALQPRHWSKIKEVTGVSNSDFNFETVNLRQVLVLDIEDVMQSLQEISESAKKEHRLEEMLKAMKREWNELHFEIISFRDTSIQILAGQKIEEMQNLLEEHVLISQTIKNSPDVMPLLSEATHWERTMLFTRDVIEIWLKVQTNYLYLWPIFNSTGIQEEVKSLLDSEGFSHVDKAWQFIMQRLQMNTLALDLNKIDNLEQTLSEACMQLESIQKNLNEYLESKRRYFPRFFFLSNEDLIEILGDSQKPERIQKHLKKCFEGINEVNFGQKEEIYQIVSKECEKVDLVTTIQPHSYDGKVEEWLYELEKQMKIGIQKVIVDGRADYPRLSLGEDAVETLSQATSKGYHDRQAWLARWQSQIVIVVSQIMWTFEVESALKSANSEKELIKLHQQSQAQLTQVVNLVREKLPDLLRLTLSSLIVIQVHAIDIIENLAKNRVNTVEEFDWINQLRYYFMEQTQLVDVRMITTKLEYCNEFLGNTGRLVITPLTDRCYRTLMSALVLNLGGAPEGPAGTGKTETTKDLAKAIAVHCIVFNCADGLKAKTMAKFFKGLASGGSWSCFDEFNRIELEVLSVIAQQVLEIQKAKNLGLRKFTFDETMIKLRPTCNIFITMNPNYAGRVDLPDNLKALFRPVAMMIPDYIAIAEISLYSFGFFESRSLAKKIYGTYRLCSEQLSTQDHYDYGMRAVKAVLTAAKNLKYEATKKQKGNRGNTNNMGGRVSDQHSAADSKSISQSVSKAGGAGGAASVITGDQITHYSYEDNEEILILKSIRDVNLPKFLADDIPLFEGIIGDLFPNVDVPSVAYMSLQKLLKRTMKEANLQTEPAFIEKIIQLYDMIKCRHGLMLVGPASSGKTTSYRVLAKAITLVASEAPQMEELPVETYIINPKSITLAQLYGNYDNISQEFSDGVLGSIFRMCSYKNPGYHRRWMVFDGPVDAQWIENMNTVLDDNKRLCLMNSEIIQMSDQMNMLFETHDLSKASPATISRCGMVYLAQQAFGGIPVLIKSWIAKFEQDCEVDTLEVVSPDFLSERFNLLFRLIFEALLASVRKQCQLILEVSNIQITKSMLKIMTILTNQASFKERIHEVSVKPEELIQRVDMIFQFAILWSLGGLVHEDSIKKFTYRLKAHCGEVFKVAGKQVRIEKNHLIPDQGLPPFNFYVDGMIWISWKDVLNRQESQSLSGDENQQQAKSLDSDIIVPTTEILKKKYLLTMFTENAYPLLFVGGTGTGKTTATQQYLRELNKKNFVDLTICFSAKTTANFTQQTIEGKLEKSARRRLSPPLGKHLIVFIDDLNMPTVEKQGAQPPIELLRQWLDHKAWFDTSEKENPLRKLTDIVFVGAMCPPSGGKNPVTPRFLRHFNIINCPNFEDKVMHLIFTKIMENHVRKENILGTDSSRLLKELVDATIAVFQFAKANLRPTPAKSHYLFNLRDVSRIVSGIQLMKTFTHGESGKLIRLWIHETGRVISDRLINSEDRETLFQGVTTAVREKLREDVVIHVKHFVDEGFLDREQIYDCMVDKIRFTDLLDASTTKSSTARNYDEVNGAESRYELNQKLLDGLRAYNLTSKRPMDLVLFDYAVTHLLRLCRILKMNRGNALLIGLGGSGRQSLTYLASFMMDQQVVQPEQNKNYSTEMWADDMKRLLISAGCDLKMSTLLLTDAQLKHSFMLEDVNNLINQYEIPSLFGPDDKIIISERVRINARKEGNLWLYNHGTQEEMLDYFVGKVRQKLHVVLAMSPTGSQLGERIRNFPSLVNCCTVDWYELWPVEALEAVARKFLEETPFDDEVKENITISCQVFHEEAILLSEKYLRDQNRHNYVTPTSYLDLMQIFQELLDKQRNKLFDKKLSYETGIEKLLSTAEKVKQMQIELNEKQPQLEEMERKTDLLVKELQEQATNVVEPKKMIIQEEEERANQVAMEAQEMKIDCGNNLAKAMPILKQAKDALDTIKPKDINEMKALGNPPAPVKFVLHAVCIMCQRKVERTPKKDNPKQLEDNWWLTATKFMNERDFIPQLKSFDKDNIPQNVINKIVKDFLDDPNFQPSRVKQASAAAKGLCEWIIKLKQYDEIARFIKPKQLALEHAQKQYKSKMLELAAKQEELKDIVDKFEQLQQKLEETHEHKLQLQNDIKDCEVKLQRAKALLEGLGEEKERWILSLEEVENSLATIVPDMLLSAGVIAYLGSFTQTYRKIAIDSWNHQLLGYSLMTSQDFTVEKVLGDQVQIIKWQMQGLPVDSFSIENGIMMTNATKWPLMIDPQGQANRWIKSMESVSKRRGHSKAVDARLLILKPNDSDFVQRLEQAIRMGMSLLLESVGEDLDPVLDPILLKQIFKVAGTKQIKFGDTNIDYADEFRLYMTSRYQNPHYLPEMTTKTTIINFQVTFEGLREQLLNLVVRKENQQLDLEHEELIIVQYENQKKMSDIENTILQVLKESKGDILNDENAIEILKSSQSLSEQIKIKQGEARATKQRLDHARQSYYPISNHCAMLFFLISKLHYVDVMYQYSLSWFIQLFSMAVENSKESEESSISDDDEDNKLDDKGGAALVEQQGKTDAEKLTEKDSIKQQTSKDQQQQVVQHQTPRKQEQTESQLSQRQKTATISSPSGKKTTQKGTKSKSKAKKKELKKLGTNVFVDASHKEAKGLSMEAQNIRERVSNVINYFTYSFYSNVCRSIFEKDKLLFSFLLTAKIRESQGKLRAVQYALLVETMTGIDNPLKQPNIFKWLPTPIWNKLCTYAHKDPFFDGLISTFQKYEDQWKMLFNCEVLTEDLYPPNDNNISGQYSPFMKLLILKAVRPDKLGQAVQQYVHSEMGQQFLTPPVFDLEQSFADSNSGTPLIFILPGTDPLSQLTQFAYTKKKYETMRTISLGQNQGPKAEKVIAEARKHGFWVLLQNCHLYPSWMPKLEQICEQMEVRAASQQSRSQEGQHGSFRLWLTSFPSEVFPSTVLQNGIKMTNEPPIGLKSNMIGSYKTAPLADNTFFEGNSNKAAFKKLAFGLTMFHAILLQRRNFGPLGWNITYQFTVSDLQISMRQLHYFVDKYPSVPFEALSYLIGECNYGGRVTEESDRRILLALLDDFMHPKVLEYNYTFGGGENRSISSGVGVGNRVNGIDDDQSVNSVPISSNPYTFPSGDNNYYVYMDKIREMPSEESPQLFGFHSNADISKNAQQARKMTEMLLQMGQIEGAQHSDESEDEDEVKKKQKMKKQSIRAQAALISAKKPEDELLEAICSDILDNIPKEPIDLETVQMLFPIVKENSMNTVLIQEIQRFNKLHSSILQSLQDISAAQVGDILMTDQLSQMRVQLLQGFVPDSWMALSYPSLKPLASYIRDLDLRIRTLHQWVYDQEPPKVFWLSGFFFTHSFLTALLQNYARKHKIEIDALSFKFSYTDQEDPTDYESDIFIGSKAEENGLQIDKPADGALVSGLYFEGCRWDYENKCLSESIPKQLYSKVPIIWLKPTEQRSKSPTTFKQSKITPDVTSLHSKNIQLNKVGKFQNKLGSKVNSRRQISEMDGRTNKLRGESIESKESHQNYMQGGSILGAQSIDGEARSQTLGAKVESAQEPTETSSSGLYRCPLYKTTERKGQLTTTGHSSNFIIMIDTPMPPLPPNQHDNVARGGAADGTSSLSKPPTSVGHNTLGGVTANPQSMATQNHWIKRGAAMLCSLSH